MQMQYTAAIADHKDLSPSVVGKAIILSQNLDKSSESISQQEYFQFYKEDNMASSSSSAARCRCTRTKSTKERTILNKSITLRWQRELSHDSSCSISYISQRSENSSVSIRSCALIFSHILEFTMKCTWGAGGYSISQTLTLPRLVSD
jgi:hypothetical protein